MIKKLTAAICAFTVAAAALLPVTGVMAAYSESDLRSAAQSAIKWKTNNDSPLYSIGSNSANLCIIAMKRMGRSYDYAAYLDGLDGVAAGYGAAHKASDMSRAAMAASASGGDAQNVGGRDLVADATYFRDAVAPLDGEGADGSIWALIALDSGDYGTPDWSIRNRNQIIANILEHQRTDGSFDGSVYTTAAAVTALARYVETGGAYTITSMETGETLEVSPRNAVRNALSFISGEQTKDGDWGDLISTAMAVIAIDTVGADAENDSRFTARGGSAIDGLMSYQNRDGGFAYDGNKSESEATSYALCALASHIGKIQGKQALFYLKARDTVSLEAKPAPATAAPRATVRPTARPSATQAARATRAPQNTMRPTKTASPKGTPDPNATPTPTPTASPRPTKRPDLVGPVMMPGPMPPTDPPEILGGGTVNETTEKSISGAVISSVIAILVLAAAVALAFLKKYDMLPNILVRKKKTDGKYKSKHHRKTEQHRRYEQRGKYKQRRKFNR